MKKVFICSPYANNEYHTVAENIAIAQTVCRVALLQGYAPYAPHLYLPNILDDENPHERKHGLQIGLQFLKECDELWAVGGFMSSGMQEEIEFARENGIRVLQMDSE